MHWQIGKGGGFHFAAAEARGQDLPATVFLGGPPALNLAAIASAAQRVVRHHVSYTSPMVIDARMKPPYPDELFCDEGNAAQVSRRWTEYFPGGGVEMGDSDHDHLD